MLVSYRVYEPEISQFVEEIKPFKMIEYNIKNKAYKLMFEDDTYVYVPKEHRLDKSIFVKNILDNCEKKDKQEFNEYYSLACNCIALRKMDDITEAQLSFNYMYSAEHFDDYGYNYDNVVISDTVFIATAHKVIKVRDGVYQFTVDGYNEAEIKACRVLIKNFSDYMNNLCDTDKELLITSDIKSEILNNVEF